jgi:hypothetical protein
MPEVTMRLEAIFITVLLFYTELKGAASGAWTVSDGTFRGRELPPPNIDHSKFKHLFIFVRKML